MTITVKEFKEYLNTLPDDTIVECIKIINDGESYDYRYMRLNILECCDFIAKNENFKNSNNFLQIGKEWW